MSGKVFQANPTTQEQAAAERYLETVSRHPAIRRLRASAIDSISPKRGDRVLDVGCGLGEMSAEFAGLVGPGGKVTAVDLNPAMIAAARVRNASSPHAGMVTYHVGDVALLDLPQSFDLVWCERVLQLVPDPDAAVRAMAGLLAPGGRLCVVDVDWSAHVVDGADDAVAARVLEAFRLKVFQPAVGRTLRRRLVRAGLTVSSLRSVHLVFTGLADAASLIPVFDRRRADLVADADRTAWFDSLEEADARGQFMTAMPIYTAVARKGPGDRS